MGILAHSAEMIKALNLPQGFSVCELGSQLFRADGARYPARDWYGRIGCGRYESIDGNGFGTIQADLNHPLLLPWRVREDGATYANVPTEFDLVTDFGTGEHIFNQAQVWATLHDLARSGGYIAFDRPKTGWENHGFYNINDTLILDIAAANQYTIVHMATNEFPGKGDMLCGVLQRHGNDAFVFPQQGKYRERLKV